MLLRTSKMAQHMHLPQSMQLQTCLHPCASCLALRCRHSRATPAAAAAAGATPAAAPRDVVFPHSENIIVDGREVHIRDIVDILAPAVTPDRLVKMQQVIAVRSYGVLPVVEGLYDMGNLAAVCRSADGKQLA
eukprot:GHRQ01028169.1.p1 GENE.GHRQ01028169.1~~GHRQ01028169.1.p1  ORF type:complete len:133 (+),score=19.27 GHRQ01028169.1:319-717(+)